jgi:hypothetical protein
MRECQFGRIENLVVRNGQPVLTRDFKVVRVARLGRDATDAKTPIRNEFELKESVRDLFDELKRLRNGTVIKLEFRHGLPFLLESLEAEFRASDQE